MTRRSLCLLSLCCGLGAWLPAHAHLRALEAAAGRGNVVAELKLGELYQYGVGEPNHLFEALIWYDRAEPASARAAQLARRVGRRLSALERLRAHALAQPPLGPPSS